MSDITSKEAIEILSHYTDLGYGIIIEGDDISKIIQALSLARKTLANGTPYNPTGDLISRSALLNQIDTTDWNDVRLLVEDAPTVEAKQDELLDYIKLSLKDSDELKEKYRNKHKESNSQHDLYYSHLFEGMAEAYDDILKKMGESESVIEKDTYQIRKAYERGFETGIYAKSKEAIGVIEDLTKALEDNGVIAQAPEIKEALKMSIEALKRDGESDTQGKSKQGEWIKNRGRDLRDNFYTCSICGRTINVICGETLADYPFCHCGAKMKGGAE